MEIMREALENLTESGGVFYSTFLRDEDPEETIIVIYFDDIMIDLMGELFQVQCRMSTHDCLQEFKCFAADMFEQFSNSQIQHIMMKTFELEFDIDYLTKSGVILDHFPTHTAERENVIRSWSKFGWRLAYSMMFGNFWQNMQPVNFIAEYYGEEFGFYFAWLVHYTGMLIIPSILGLIVFIYQAVKFF